MDKEFEPVERKVGDVIPESEGGGIVVEVLGKGHYVIEGGDYDDPG